MRAAVRQVYGPPGVIAIEDVAVPEPGHREIRVRVRAASVNLGDWELLTGEPRYIAVLAHLFSRRQHYRFAPDSVTARGGGRFAPKSKILGTDYAGTVDAAGAGVTRFGPGDEVFGLTERFGAFAEYVCVPESSPVAVKPPALSFEQAAALPQAALIAVQAMRDRAAVRAGQAVLVNGAGGGAGTLAVQLARLYGAEVTGVDGPAKLDMLRSIGAAHVVDYTRQDFTAGGRQYDAILDLAAHRSVFKSRRALKPSGIYMMAGGSGQATWQSAFLGPFISGFGRGRVRFFLAASRSADLDYMAGLVADGSVRTVIDGSYPLAETGAALQRVGDKQGIGKVLIIP